MVKRSKIFNIFFKSAPRSTISIKRWTLYRLSKGQSADSKIEFWELYLLFSTKLWPQLFKAKHHSVIFVFLMIKNKTTVIKIWHEYFAFTRSRFLHFTLSQKRNYCQIKVENIPIINEITIWERNDTTQLEEKETDLTKKVWYKFTIFMSFTIDSTTKMGHLIFICFNVDRDSFD